jgi:tetratricopeptide (TPR) repeat protein
METNAVTDQVVRLSEQWRNVSEAHPATGVFCWLCASMMEYRMIHGFTMFHMSEESTLYDIFIASRQSFDASSRGCYGKKILEKMSSGIESWNKDARLTSARGVIGWEAVYDDKRTDASGFVYNMTRLAVALSCDGKEKKLVVALLPDRIEDMKAYRDWIKEILKAQRATSVRYMLCDTYDARLFDDIEKDSPLYFKYIKPDLDMPGAIDSLLEEQKQEEEDEEIRDLISYRQLLLKVAEASGEGDEEEAVSNAVQAIEAIHPYHKPHMEAVVYFFLHSLYLHPSLGNSEKAEANIDKAIVLSKKAAEADLEGSRISCCQYLVSKANMYFTDKKYEKAIPPYTEALDYGRAGCPLEVTITIYQMLGVCKRKAGYFDSWDYFKEGWKLVETLEEEAIKKHLPLRYYAAEMLKVASYKEQPGYEKRFSELWGADWKKDIKEGKKEQKERLSVVS